MFAKIWKNLDKYSSFSYSCVYVHLPPGSISRKSRFSGDYFYFVYLPTFRPPNQVVFHRAMFLTTLHTVYHYQKIGILTQFNVQRPEGRKL